MLFRKKPAASQTDKSHHAVVGDVTNTVGRALHEKPILFGLLMLIPVASVVVTIMGRPRAAVVTYSLWDNTTKPTIIADNDNKPVELGVKFKADVDGKITGIRYYKSAKNTGRHVGKLWSSSGQRLARVVFSKESSTGWQTATFSTPVAIKANTVYIASYYTETGYYSADNDYFAGKGRDNGPLHALADGVNGGNGVYLYSRGGGFPTQSYRSSNYWVDVAFEVNTSLTAPTGLTAVALSSSQIDLQWNSVAGANSYQIYRNGAPYGTSKTNSYLDASVTGNTSYSYYVKALSLSGESSPASNTATVTPPSGPAPTPIPTSSPTPTPPPTPAPTTQPTVTPTSLPSTGTWPSGWDDPRFANNTASGGKYGQSGTFQNLTVTDNSGQAMFGPSNYTVLNTRMRGREGPRVSGSNILIRDSYIEVSGSGDDHADGIQAYNCATSNCGNANFKNVVVERTKLVMTGQALNAGIFLADHSGVDLTLKDVYVDGGPSPNGALFIANVGTDKGCNSLRFNHVRVTPKVRFEGLDTCTILEWTDVAYTNGTPIPRP